MKPRQIKMQSRESAPVILETMDVHKFFSKLVAVQGVDMSVEQGEVFGIAGPNGAGKSTLFNLIAGTYPLSKGQIFFDGHDISSMRAHQVCRLGLGRTFQVPKTFPTLSVYDNLRVGSTFGLGLRGKKCSEKVHETLDFLGLTPFKDTEAHNLDLYTTKLVMMGASLAANCKLLMLDEPLGGLSSSEVSAFLNVVRKINGENGITLIIIEHLLDSLIEISDRMLILDGGHVIYFGKPEGIREDEKVREVYLGEETVP